jgi:two-component system sensor histidine kinase RegB
MKFSEASKKFSLNKSTYINLRWIAYTGQLTTIFLVQFLFELKFYYLPCIFIIIFSIFTNIYLILKIKENILNNFYSTLFLNFDILQLSILFFFTGGITNPFIFLIIIPAVFSSQHLSIKTSVGLTAVTSISLLFLSFFYFDLPSATSIHFHVPAYYLYSIPIAIFIGLVFLVYFGSKFGTENRIRKEAYDKMQEIMAKENELVSLGGQAAAAAHSLGTPLSTILLTAKELKKDFGNNIKIKNDLDLLVSQSNRCSEIIKKLTLNPIVEDEFLDNEVSLDMYIKEIVKSYQEISDKKFFINLEKFQQKIKSYKSPEIVYGLRNFIGNANKFSKSKIEISLKSNRLETSVLIKDDGPGFPKDLIDKARLGEPYIRSKKYKNLSKYGLGLGTFIGKTLLEKNYAKISFNNSINYGAEVLIIWNNKDFKKI